MTEQVILVLSTCPDDAVAQQLAQALVHERLATCVNRTASVRSTYRWQGEVREDAEVLLMIKTTSDRLVALEARVRALHPYELPELLVVPVTGGSEAYLQWVRDGVEAEGESK